MCVCVCVSARGYACGFLPCLDIQGTLGRGETSFGSSSPTVTLMVTFPQVGAIFNSTNTKVFLRIKICGCCEGIREERGREGVVATDTSKMNSWPFGVDDLLGQR